MIEMQSSSSAHWNVFYVRLGELETNFIYYSQK